MKPEYIAVHFTFDDQDPEIWMALLSEWPFESFHQEESLITGYIQDHDITSDLMQFIEKNKDKYYQDFNLEKVEDRNWNTVWESSFNPVIVDDKFYIRADFHAHVENFKHVITIAPKMAFGTGHHATTFMMLQTLADIDLRNKTVLDFGCGTGILSVAAALEGATKITGIDIQTEAVENSIEHAKMNHVSDVCHFLLGDLDVLTENKYDVIFANISRQVIIDNILILDQLLPDRGELLISGIMFDDVEVISLSLSKTNLRVINKKSKDQWSLLYCKKQATIV